MKTAVFYDLENIGLESKNGMFEKKLLALQKKIEKSDLVGEIVLQKAYIRKTDPALAQIEPMAEKLNVQLVPVEPMSGVPQKKTNMVDFKMGVDVTATIIRKRSIQTVAVASGDSDFGFLCQHIKEMEKNLLVISRFSVTGDILLKLCDDWIDLGGHDVQPKFITKVIDVRIKKEYKGKEFFEAFGGFLRAMEADSFIRRYMTKLGMPISVFVAILHDRHITFPKYNKLGFANVTAFVSALLYDTGFEHEGGIVKYTGEKEPLSQAHLIEKMINMPPGYSSQKLLRYYDILTEAESVDELATYINFMKQTGILKGSTLCQREAYQSVIFKHIQLLLEASGMVLNEDVIAKVKEKI